MLEYHKLNDNELTDLVRKSDELAFAEIYQRYWTIMYMHALKMLKNEEDARDVIQELFTTLWSKCQSLTSSINLSGYLYTIVRNKVLDLIEQKKTRSIHLESLALYLEEHHNKTLEDLTEREMMQALDHEIGQLPGKMRVIFQMRVKEHKTYKEIAEALEISDKTVKKQVSNAIKLIKPKLSGFTGWPLLLYFLSR
ncbi:MULTISPECIES: RNA polymerase sigma factor [Pedobacter]|uniref:RNA polymerase sigma factor, sigma-70 family n=1 Tax=Pedobacter heparinus (strain ATCC 13125 / DSM 2366 / CIP 104194 / JCM 7457 / NBRC 12017 / NCIMB 9290 / NRRL B-14731 / HIM 762-3) TaxID=485917 RepID=C6Y1G9_PEDHD|nr:MULTISPECIES: RNA polymerase sigma-70 factor [Pedobacter]ACU02945.1 RNA polymerase sigma factor, sigma-70 family [Pedobacter heparinus DSM 2366]MBB5440690.1 RNA polymerase sigma-70 factor (ECF subfamily) [Pedobacter sp. AK017]